MIKNKVVYKALIYLFTDGLNKAIPFLLLPILTIYLTPADYGLVNNFNVLLGIVLVFVGLSSSGAISSNYYKLNKEEKAIYIGNAIYIIFALFIIVFITVLLSADLIFDLLKIPIEYQLLCVLLAFNQATTSINTTLWRLEEKPLIFGVYNITQTILNFGVSLFLIIHFQQGWEGRVNGILIGGITYGILSLLLLYKRNYLKFNFNKSYNRDILIFGLPLIPHALSIWIRSGVDKIFITNFIGAHENGLYSVGFQFGMLVSFITVACNNALIPPLFKNLSVKTAVELNVYKKKLVRFNLIAILLLLILGIVLSILSYYIIELFLDKRYLDSQPFVAWAIFAQVFQGMYLLFVNYIFYQKKTKILASITIGCSLLQVLLSYILIRKFGALGGAYSSTIISFINFIFIAYFSNKIFPLPWRSIVK